MEVDLEYPALLYEVHNYYPLAGEKLRVSKDMLSPYSKSIRHKFGVVSSKYQNYLQLWQTRRIMFLITNICSYMFFLVEAKESTKGFRIWPQHVVETISIKDKGIRKALLTWR